MRTLIKNTLRATLTPLMRAFSSPYEDARRIRAYLVLCSRITHPVDSSVVVMGAVEVRGTGNIRLGNNLLLYPGLYFETLGDGSLHVGDNVVMSRGVHLVAHSGITIGAGSMIGEYTSIRDANHVRDASGALRDGDHFSAPVTIGKQVWIGRGVTVLPGISIGDNATVGANAVVTRNVPPGVTVVGVPAAPVGAGRRADLIGKALH